MQRIISFITKGHIGFLQRGSRERRQKILLRCRRGSPITLSDQPVELQQISKAFLLSSITASPFFRRKFIEIADGLHRFHSKDYINCTLGNYINELRSCLNTRPSCHHHTGTLIRQFFFNDIRVRVVIFGKRLQNA